MSKALLLSVVALLSLGGRALAATPDQAATDLSTEIMSPFCPGVTLHECPSAEALRLRDRIESWFREGMTRAQVLDRLESEYGTGIHASPEPTGIGLTAWLVIAGAVIAGLVIATFLIRRWSERGGGAPRQPLTALERERVDQELSRLRAEL